MLQWRDIGGIKKNLPRNRSITSIGRTLVMSRLDKVSWEPRLCLCGCKTPTLMVDRNRGNSHLPKGSYRVFASRECYYRYHERVGSGKTHCPYGHKLQLRKHSRAKKGTSLTCRVCNTLRSRAKKMGVSSDQLMEHWPPPLLNIVTGKQIGRAHG